MAAWRSDACSDSPAAQRCAPAAWKPLVSACARNRTADAYDAVVHTCRCAHKAGSTRPRSMHGGSALHEGKTYQVTIELTRDIYLEPPTPAAACVTRRCVSPCAPAAKPAQSLRCQENHPQEGRVRSSSTILSSGTCRIWVQHSQRRHSVDSRTTSIVCMVETSDALRQQPAGVSCLLRRFLRSRFRSKFHASPSYMPRYT